MAVRPLAFGARFAHRGRTVRLRREPQHPQRYAVEVTTPGAAPRVSRHASLADARRAFAAAWRARLH
jgi:hypothetical protein